MSLVVDISFFYNWILIIGLVISLIYAIFIAVQLFSIIRIWRYNRFEGIDKFWSLCLILASKNALLLQEYIDVYNYKLNKTNNRVTGDNNNDQLYIIDDDTSYQSLSPLEFKNIIKRIHSYIRLSYDLSTLKKSDNLVLSGNSVFCNVSDQSITNKRNRNIENMINKLDKNKKTDIVTAWNAVDKRNMNNYITIIPYRWINYEYRNLFRYLNSSKILRDIYNYLGNDFMTYQNTVNEISGAMHNIYCKSDSYIPLDISTMSVKLSDILSIIMDVLLGTWLIKVLLSSTNLFGFLFNITITPVFGFSFHFILIMMFYTIRDMILVDRSYDLSKKMDQIMKQIEILCC
jgi:hypothetical protein